MQSYKLEGEVKIQRWLGEVHWGSALDRSVNEEGEEEEEVKEAEEEVVEEKKKKKKK